MKFLKILATAASLAIAGVGLIGMLLPAVLLEFARSLLVPPALYGVAAVRILFGALLLVVAASSHLPRILRAIGALIIVVGLLTPFMGLEQFDEALRWFSQQGLVLFRSIAALPVLAGLFLAFAINGGGRAR